MLVTPIKSGIFRQDNDLYSYINKYLNKILKSNNAFIFVITSKIVSIFEKNIVLKTTLSKEALIKKEADVYIGKSSHNVHITIKHGHLIPSAGIDESNSEKNHYILLPNDPFKSAEKICKYLRKTFKNKKIGVIITDSRSQPLRRGVSGIALAYAGFKGVKKMIGKRDLFGRKLEATYINIADSLACAAVLCMGEADESQPMAVIESFPVCYTENTKAKEIKIPPKHDLFMKVLKK